MVTEACDPPSIRSHPPWWSNERTRPHPAGLLHRPTGPPAARQPGDRGCLPRCAATPARLRLETGPQATVATRHRRPRRVPDRQLPGPPGARAGERRAHPQRPPSRRPLPVPLRRPASPRACPAHPARTRHTAEAIRPSAHQLPQPFGGGRAAGLPGPRHLDGAARPCAAARGHPDRCAPPSSRD